MLFVAAILLAVLVARLGAALPLAMDFERVVSKPGKHEPPVEQFETVKRRVAISSYSQLDLHSRLRPLVQDIAAARLSRRYGIDLGREPERAAALLEGNRIWELVRSDREPPTDRFAPGWSEHELERLVEELETF